MSNVHEHKCTTCGGTYLHEHDFSVEDHAQDPFQCPHEGCANYYKSGKSPRPPRNTWIQKGGELIIKESIKKNETLPKPESNLSNWQKTIQIFWKQGKISCKNELHFKKHREQPKANPTPVPLGDVGVLLRMLPFAEATCECERRACREAWTWNTPGTYQTEFVIPGIYHKGVGVIDPNRAPKRVMPIRFRLSTEEFKLLHSIYNDWLFIQVASGGHDHPVSHIMTQIATYELFASLKGKCLDLHGNPTANERRNQSNPGLQTETYVNLVTAKDHYRKATKWGSQFDGAGKARWHTGPYITYAERHMADLLRDKNVVTGIHTGYYYSNAEILSVLRGCKEDATMELVMHRFEGSAGTFNNNELSWERRGGMIVQTNTATGESYEHPDNSRWFTGGSWTDVVATDAGPRVDTHREDEHGNSIMVENPNYGARRGLTWSCNKMAPGVYKVSIATCTAEAAIHGAASAPVCGSNIESIKRSGVVLIDMGTPVSIPIRAEHAELFDSLRTSMVAVTRCETKYRSHVNTVKSKCQSWAVDGKLPALPDSQSVSNLIEASFWIDFRRDCGTALATHAQAQWMTKQYDLALAGKSLGKASNSVGLVLDIIAHALRAKTGKETAAAVLESIRLVTQKIT